MKNSSGSRHSMCVKHTDEPRAWIQTEIKDICLDFAVERLQPLYEGF